MGFFCPSRQTTADFLTSITSPAERLIRPGFESRVPRTPEEFATTWKGSSEYARLLQDIDAYDQKYPIGGESVTEFTNARRSLQAVHQYVLFF